jgi:tetratricopeptide (TPR) repeat protein
VSDTRLGLALEAWFEATLGGERPEPGEFASRHGVSPDEFAAYLVDAGWLAGRHHDARGATPRSPPFSLGDVDVLAEAGRGAMGIVYRGVQRPLDRAVAVKMLQPELARAPRGVERFAREARAAAQLRHPNVVRVLSIGTHDDVPFLVMEWIEGESLAAVLDRRRAVREPPRPVHHRAAALLIARVARALQHAHEHGLVHRDVKPANILVDTDGEPRLVDFGLVRDLSAATLTGSHELVGSLAYMGPEQVRGHRSTPQTDVYSLGVTLYECLTLSRAFGEAGTANLQRRIVDGAFVPPRALCPEIPPELDSICRMAMAREPATRYPSAAAFAADLEAWLRNEPTHARPPSTILRARRWLAARRRTVASAVATAVVGTAFAFTWAHQAGQIDERDRRAAWERLGRATALADAEAVMPEFDAAVAARPDDPHLRLLRALSRIDRRQFAEARTDIAATRTADTVAALALAAARLCDRLEHPTGPDLDLGPLPDDDDATGAAWLVRAELLRRTRQFEAASACYGTARTLDPVLAPLAGAGLVHCRARLGEWRAARDESRAIGLSCASPRALADAVRFTSLTGDPEAARGDARELRMHHPDSAWNAFAELLLFQPRPEDASALDTIRARAEAAPRDWPAVRTRFLKTLADRYRRCQEPATAVRIFRELVEAEPQSPSLRGLLGTALLQHGEQPGEGGLQAQGLVELEHAALLGDASSYERDVHWGTYWFYAGDPIRAAVHYRHSVSVSPTDPTRWRQLAGACLRSGLCVEGPTERVAWLEAGVAAQETEASLSVHDVGAWGLLVTQLDELAKALAEAGRSDSGVGRRRDEVVAHVRFLAQRGGPQRDAR